MGEDSGATRNVGTSSISSICARLKPRRASVDNALPRLLPSLCASARATASTSSSIVTMVRTSASSYHHIKYADGTGRDHQRRLQSRRLAGDKSFSRASRPATTATTIVRDDGTLGRAKSYLACDPTAGGWPWCGRPHRNATHTGRGRQRLRHLLLQAVSAADTGKLGVRQEGAPFMATRDSSIM